MSSDPEEIVTVVTKTKVSAEDIATIATDTEVRAKALSVVKKKLGHILGTGPDSEVNQIAEDALNTVTVGLLNTCAEKATPLMLEGLHIPAHHERPFRTNVNTYSGST